MNIGLQRRTLINKIHLSISVLNTRWPVSRVLSFTRCRAEIVIPLGWLSPATSRDLPGPLARKTPAMLARGARPLFGLAPGGVYPATCVAAGAVRSYRTISPLPTCAGGIISVALSLGSLPAGITRHRFPWSPDFPPDALRHPATIRPSGISRVLYLCVKYNCF